MGGAMDNKEFGRWLEQRTRRFAVRIIKLAARLPDTPEGRVVRYQLVKAGTSIGANYREANRPRSRADFDSHIAICEKEASETQYWLEIIIEAEMLPAPEVEPDYKECSELLALFTSIEPGSHGKRRGSEK